MRYHEEEIKWGTRRQDEGLKDQDGREQMRSDKKVEMEKHFVIKNGQESTTKHTYTLVYNLYGVHLLIFALTSSQIQVTTQFNQTIVHEILKCGLNIQHFMMILVIKNTRVQLNPLSRVDGRSYCL